jgi:NADPH-dependent 2,4-dienoyl-CoA reductase/sulfur reductase-like enzyme
MWPSKHVLPALAKMLHLPLLSVGEHRHWAQRGCLPTHFLRMLASASAPGERAPDFPAGAPTRNVVIVGGGWAGLATAYHLLNRFGSLTLVLRLL